MKLRQARKSETEAAVLSACDMLLKAKELLQPEYAQKVFVLFTISLDDLGLIAPACDIIDHYFADPKYRKESAK